MQRCTLGSFSLALMIACTAALPVSANIFTHIVREAGEAGGKAASHGFSHLGPVGKAAAHLKSLVNAPKGALAAHATPEGHWQFVNREGQVFTAGTADEMKRAMPALVPDALAGGEGKMTLYLSEDSVFQNRAALDQLPRDADLHIVTDSGALNVTRTGNAKATRLEAQIKPNLIAELTERDQFDETIAYLARPLNRSNIRTVALEPGAAPRLASAPKLDPESKLPLVEQLDPENLAEALQSVRGQTVLVTGSVADGKITFSPSNGAAFTRDVTSLTDAARQADVNLIVVHTDAGRQPGGRNWLWQTMEVGGMPEASTKATYGDFLDLLAERRGGFRVSAANDGAARIQVTAAPVADGSGIVNDASNYLGEAVGKVTGDIVSTAIDLYGPDKEAQSELDARLIPGIPASIQIPYLVSLICGLIAWPTSRHWFQRLWPTAEPSASRAGRITRKTAREITYFLAFLPVAGFPAVIWHLTVQTWQTLTAPFRWLHRRFLRREV